jgi:hypothetical protein
MVEGPFVWHCPAIALLVEAVYPEVEGDRVCIRTDLLLLR